MMSLNCRGELLCPAVIVCHNLISARAVAHKTGINKASDTPQTKIETWETVILVLSIMQLPCLILGQTTLLFGHSCDHYLIISVELSRNYIFTMIESAQLCVSAYYDHIIQRKAGAFRSS